MDLIYVGRVVNTHGLKGEIRILSDFKFKQNVFKKGIRLNILSDTLTINSYRTHKNYDMVIFEGLNSIEDVLQYKGEKVYINREDLEYEGYLDEDLIGMEVYDNDKYMGKVSNILKNNVQDILVIENGKKHMVPNVSEFVKDIDLENKKIFINYIKGLVDED